MEDITMQIPEGWEDVKLGNTNYFKILGSGIDLFDGKKDYLSTSSIEEDRVIAIEQEITYKLRPSRANMQPIVNSVWFAKMKNTLKVFNPSDKQTQNTILSTGFCGIFSKNVCSDFLFQIFLSNEFNNQKDLLAIGSTQEAINNTKVKHIQFLLPKSTTEQKKIAQILSTVDTAIKQTEQLIVKYERIKTGLMQDLFTKGIDENGNIRSEETHEFKDSELGRIPKEWKCLSLEKISLEIIDCPHSTPKYIDEGYLVARTQNIKNGVYIIETSSYLSRNGYKERVSRLEPKPDDIIFTREAPIGEAFVIPQGMKIALGQRVMLFRLNSEIMIPSFLIELIYSDEVQTFFTNMVAGTTVSHLNVKDVKELLFKVPATNEQKRIMDLFLQHRKLINVFTGKLQKLQSIKTGLIQNLLSGKKRVTNLIKEKAL